MLPTNKRWFCILLVMSLVIGIFGGISSLIFFGVANSGIDYFFGNSTIGFWSGEWWWIPLTAFGGLLVAWLRQTWKLTEDLPGSIALAQKAWIDPEVAPKLLAITIISLILGASLGPSYGLIIMGGGFGSWLATRLSKKDNEDISQDYTLTGMAGNLGAAFSAPIFAATLASELSPTPKRNYVTMFVPELIAATMGFLIFFGVTGQVMLHVFGLPPYQFELKDLLNGVILGVFSAITLAIFVIIKKIATSIANKLSNLYLRSIIGGTIVGLISFALPLTATSGSNQLIALLRNTTTVGILFVAAVVIAKMLAVAVSQSVGFLGGIVFPIIFIGGAAGVLVNLIFPAIPLSLAVAAMLAAVPGGFLDAPLSMILIALGTAGLGLNSVAPVGVAVIIAHLCFSTIINIFSEKAAIGMHDK